MSSENLWIHNKASAIYKKRHFLWRLGMGVTAKAHTTVSKSLWSNKGFMVPLAPSLAAGAFGVFGKRHYVRELHMCWLRGVVK